MASTVKLTAVNTCYYEDPSEKNLKEKGKVANPGETFTCLSDVAERFIALGAATRPGQPPVAVGGEDPPPVISKTAATETSGSAANTDKTADKTGGLA